MYCVIVCSIMFWCFAINVKAEENDLIMYAYVHQTEHKYSIGLDRKLQKTKKKESIGESIAKPFIPDSMSSCNGDVSTYSIIQGHNLNMVDRTKFPYTTITHLDIGFDTTGDGKADYWCDGSGYIVGPDVMVTAGHCFWSKKYGWAKEVRTYLMYEQNLSREYYYPASWITSTAYTQGGDSEYDWCVVTMQQNVGATTGWLGFGVSSSLVNKDIRVAGFTQWESMNIHLFESYGQIKQQNERIIGYNASTTEAQAGGPVFDEDGIAWGIHTTGGALNSGCTINSYLFDLLSSKREEGINKYK